MSDYRDGTTTRNSLVKEVVNITYTGGRKQSEILKELHPEQVESGEPDVPVSSTPEQVVKYFEEIIAGTKDRQKIHIYSQAIRWIKENEEQKREKVADMIKEFNARNMGDESPLEEIRVD